MDDSTLSYIITANTPDNINNKIWEVKKKFNLYVEQQKIYKDSIITLNVAHITIKRRFYLKQGISENELLDSIDRIDKPQIEIHPTKLETFVSDSLGNVIVAIVEKSKDLQKLHEHVLQAVIPFTESVNSFEGETFNPHISITYSVPDDKLDEIKHYAKEEILPISFVLNNLFVLKNIPGIKRERSIIKKYLFFRQ